MQAKQLQHQKRRIGPLPFIDQVFDRLELTTLLSAFIGHERYVQAIELLVKNLLVEPVALYRIRQWAEQFELQHVGAGPLGDDALGRALDRLFSIDRATLQTQLTINSVAAYAIDTSVIHNDSTTLKFYGAYKTASRNAVQLKRGHSKDHRPDLKQLVYNLSITEDGAVPVHFKCHDGNRTDDTLHIETWLTLRGILGRSDFLYVADAKLCTAENLCKLDKEGGRFVTIVPNTRTETQTFAERCYQSQVRWEVLTRRESTRHKGKYDVFQRAEGFYQLAEGFRLFWYRSSAKRQRDEDRRRERIDAAVEKLTELQTQRRRGPKTERGLLTAATEILRRYQVASWLHVEAKTRDEEHFKRVPAAQAGSPGLYRRVVKRIPYLIVTHNHQAIARAAAIDGVFPLTTNTDLDAKAVLLAYKYQPHLEKRFSWIKSDYELAPVFLKKTSRIEALMFVGYLADLVAALIQRQLRQAIKDQQLDALHILPEERPTQTPTWEQVQRLFAQHSKYILTEKQKPVATFCDELTSHQLNIIELLNVPKDRFSG